MEKWKKKRDFIRLILKCDIAKSTYFEMEIHVFAQNVHLGFTERENHVILGIALKLVSNFCN